MREKGAISMYCRFRLLLTKHFVGATALSLLILFSPALSQAQITPSGDSYTNTADATVIYALRTMLGYVVAIELAFTILVALACVTVLALIGISISNQRAKSEERQACEQKRSSSNLDQPSIPSLQLALPQPAAEPFR
jgi:hypothetical protein